MIYQLPCGRTIEISIDQYLSMSDDELSQISSSTSSSDELPLELNSTDQDDNFKLDLNSLFPDDDSPKLT